MKTIMIWLIITLIPTAIYCQTNWKATSGSVTFKIKNAGSTVDGRFSNLRTVLLFSPDRLASSSLKGSVDINTINTGNSKRDKDLQGEKYFNAGKYKLVEVSSTKLYKKGNQYAGLFNVTMKGVTRKMEIPFSFVQKGNDAEFQSSFSVNRREFGVGSKNGLAMMMGDNVTVSVDIKAQSQANTKGLARKR